MVDTLPLENSAWRDHDFRRGITLHRAIHSASSTPMVDHLTRRMAAALEQASLKEYVTQILEHHVTELEKKGVLPKGK